MKGHPWASGIVSWLVVGAVGGLIINATVKQREGESTVDFNNRRMLLSAGVGTLAIASGIGSYYSNK